MTREKNEKTRLLTEREIELLEGILYSAIRMGCRVREMQAAINTINSEPKECQHCKREVNIFWRQIAQDWTMLKSSFQGLIENSHAIQLSSRLLELLEENDFLEETK